MDKLRFSTRYGYVTATERRLTAFEGKRLPARGQIRSLIDQGMSEPLSLIVPIACRIAGGTARKYYKVVDNGPDWMAIQVSSYERDDWGRPQTRKSMVTVMGVERPVQLGEAA